jgi:Na+/phosphate symporter
LFAKLAIAIIPDRAEQARAIIEPKFLDDELIRVPSMALERARLELGHMGQLTAAMLARLGPAFRSGDLSGLSQQHDQIVVLREAVITYLQHVGRGELSDADADEHALLLVGTAEIENMSAAISRDLAPLADTLKDADLAPSSETAELLQRLFEAVQRSALAALQALVERDERAAQSVVGQRNVVLNFAAELHRQQSARLARDEPDRLLRHRVQFEMVDRLRRIYSVAEHMAISVLPRGVLAGELSG